MCCRAMSTQFVPEAVESAQVRSQQPRKKSVAPPPGFPALPECEDETTDEGSSTSDAETSCSSTTGVSDDSERRQPCFGGASTLHLPLPRRGLRTAMRRTGWRESFGGTPLSPIPGTPNTPAERSVSASPAKSPTKASSSVEGPQREGPAERMRAAAALFNVQEGDIGLVTKAKQEGLPLKVRTAAGLLGQPGRVLDPRLPAKKRPPFPELGFVPVTALQGIDRTKPLTKPLPRFLLADPPRTPLALLHYRVGPR